MSRLYYICKYTPVEMLTAMGAECVLLETPVSSFSEAERAGHPNLCGYGKTILETVIGGGIRDLVLVNCCDTIRSVYDILRARNECGFLYLMDLVHDESECGAARQAFELRKLYDAYSKYRGTGEFSFEKFEAAFEKGKKDDGSDYIGILGARAGSEFTKMIADTLPLRVKDLTCVAPRNVERPENGLPRDFFDDYAKALICQTPCMRMNDIAGRKRLYNDPHLKAAVYSTIKFCDYYGFEYSELKKHTDIPVLKLETDYTRQSAGQLSTRLEAFSEQLLAAEISGPEHKTEIGNMNGKYFAGIDSGSTGTKAVITDCEGNIVSCAVTPTGAKVSESSAAALNEALKEAALSPDDLANIVTTGYGRKAVKLDGAGGNTVTEISCHAKGAHALDKSIRTIIDIGGQDSKVICVDEAGNVTSFAMNDKCAAGTGRFLEMTGRALGLSLSELGSRGLKWKEDIAISNTCTVFAESEIISLVAEEKSIDDIVHALNRSVAVKISSLLKRTGASPAFMMTGGVAGNASVVKALEEMLGCGVKTDPMSLFCGAYGAALYALGK